MSFNCKRHYDWYRICPLCWRWQARICLHLLAGGWERSFYCIVRRFSGPPLFSAGNLLNPKTKCSHRTRRLWLQLYQPGLRDYVSETKISVVSSWPTVVEPPEEVQLRKRAFTQNKTPSPHSKSLPRLWLQQSGLGCKQAVLAFHVGHLSRLEPLSSCSLLCCTKCFCPSWVWGWGRICWFWCRSSSSDLSSIKAKSVPRGTVREADVLISWYHWCKSRWDHC